MARHRKKRRTHVGAKNGSSGNIANAHPATRTPKSMVIRVGAGEVGPSVSQLVKDVRAMMEPDTASRLRERRANRLRDYLAMAGPLGVSHLMLFSRSESGNTNLRLAMTPRGPTLHFRVERYSLCKDIQKSLRHPKGSGKEHLTPPLLVMNNFLSSKSDQAVDSPPQVPHYLESLTTSIFQSIFPPISPQSSRLTSIRRVLLLNRENDALVADDGAYVLNLRHYAITTRATGLSRPLRRLNAAEKLLRFQQHNKSRRKGVPDLGSMEDIADYMIGGEQGDGYLTDGTSASEVDSDAEVEVLEKTTRKISSTKARQSRQENEGRQPKSEHSVNHAEKHAVKLVELGPRMTLRLTKVEDGVCSGKTLWHEYISKSTEELKQMDLLWEKRRAEKDERRRIQKANIEKKRKLPNDNSAITDPDDWDSEELLQDDTDFDDDPDTRDDSKG